MLCWSDYTHCRWSVIRSKFSSHAIHEFSQCNYSLLHVDYYYNKWMPRRLKEWFLYAHFHEFSISVSECYLLFHHASVRLLLFAAVENRSRIIALVTLALTLLSSSTFEFFFYFWNRRTCTNGHIPRYPIRFILRIFNVFVSGIWSRYRVIFDNV